MMSFIRQIAYVVRAIDNDRAISSFGAKKEMRNEIVVFVNIANYRGVLTANDSTVWHTYCQLGRARSIDNRQELGSRGISISEVAHRDSIPCLPTHTPVNSCSQK